ncbi:MAG TPA: helix-turn-helix domain-containing protein [Kofleriaceae bacterium]|jgi:AcrR family transcriptional regulator
MSLVESSNRPLRADAQRNLDRLLAAADAEFTEHGAGASLEDIAKRARVGIGTLYRHFPTRDDLLARVISDSFTAVIERGRELLLAPSPFLGLVKWIEALVGQLATYNGLTGALSRGYVKPEDTQLCAGCVQMEAVGNALLARAQDAGEIRPDAEVKEVILSAHAAAWIAESTKDPAAVDRLLSILFDGLRAGATKKRKAPK